MRANINDLSLNTQNFSVRDSTGTINIVQSATIKSGKINVQTENNTTLASTQIDYIKDKDVSFNMVDSNGLTVNSFVVNNILAPIHIDQEASGNQLTLIFNEIVEDLLSLIHI